MPLYTITTQAGVLGKDGKAALAVRLTEMHCDMAGVPKNWVHVVFIDYPAGSGFTAGEPAAAAALTLLIRTGRSPEYKRDLLRASGDCSRTPPARRTTRSLSEFRKCRRARRWRWGRSCRTSPSAETPSWPQILFAASARPLNGSNRKRPHALGALDQGALDGPSRRRAGEKDRICRAMEFGSIIGVLTLRDDVGGDARRLIRRSREKLAALIEARRRKRSSSSRGSMSSPTRLMSISNPKRSSQIRRS